MNWEGKKARLNARRGYRSDFGRRRSLKEGVALLSLAIAGTLANAQAAHAQDEASQADTKQDRENGKKAADTAPKSAIDREATAEDIIVIGTRASLQSAIARKRDASTIVDSIVADDIASFPDKNVGEALSRITGVQLSREYGEGVAVSIRGVEPDLNRVEIDGVSQVSAEGVRAGDFRELAAELVKSIDVYKGYAADITEGGIGGTVRVETRKALELKKPLFSLVGSMQRLDLTGDWRPRATLVAGTPHFLFDGLGAMINITYDDKTTRQDYASNTNWARLADFDHSAEKTVADPLYDQFDTYESCADVGGASTSKANARRLACETQFFDWAPRLPRYRSNTRHDRRISSKFQLQWEMAHNFRAYAQAQINLRDQRLIDNALIIDAQRYERFNVDPQLPNGLNGAVSRPRVTLGTATVDDNHVVTSWLTALNGVNVGTATKPSWNGAASIAQLQHRDFSYDQNSKYYQTGFDWLLDRVRVKGIASYATSHTEGNTNYLGFSTGISGITVDRDNALGIPAFIFPDGLDPADQTFYSTLDRVGADGQPLVPQGSSVNYRPTDKNNSEKQLKLDVDWNVDFGPISSIEYGGQYRHQRFLNYATGGSRLLSAPGEPLVYQSEANVSQETVITDNPPARRIGDTYYLTPAEFQAMVAGNTAVSGGAPLFTGLPGRPDNIPTRLIFGQFNPGNLMEYYDLSGFDQDLVRFADGLPQIPQLQVEEKIFAAYGMANFETDLLGMRITGNAGLRYAFTRDTGIGTYVSRVKRLKPTGGSETVVIAAQQSEISNSYHDWLPAFNLSVDITPDLVLRANWARNLARPKPSNLVATINCVEDQTDPDAIEDACSAGNPDLLPYRADQWEVNLAWYPNRDTLVSLGYYKKFQKTFVIPNVTRSGVDLFKDGVLYTVRQPINGYGAKLDGIEASAQTVFSFLPKPFDGLGVTGNLTWSRAIETGLTNEATGEPLREYPGLSKWSYNASIFYDKGRLNARLSYNYRSDWLISIRSSGNGNAPVYRKAEGYLDGKITVRFPELNTNLFVEMTNMKKEYVQSYVKDVGPLDTIYPGRRLFLGFQVKF